MVIIKFVVHQVPVSNLMTAQLNVMVVKELETRFSEFVLVKINQQLTNCATKIAELKLHLLVSNLLLN